MRRYSCAGRRSLKSLGLDSPGRAEPQACQRQIAVRSGFSVIEMMVALSVVGVALAGMAQLLGVAVQQGAFARYNTVGIEVARGKIEELQAAFETELVTGEYSPLMTLGRHGPAVVALSDDGGKSEVTRHYWVSWEVADAGRGQRRVSVEVRPSSGFGQDDVNTTGKTIRILGHFTP